MNQLADISKCVSSDTSLDSFDIFLDGFSNHKYSLLGINNIVKKHLFGI